MDSGYLLRREHDEFALRMEEEHSRQNHRITVIEDNQKQIIDLNVSVRELVLTTKSMLEEQKAQGERLAALESRDGEMWRKVVGYAVTAIVGIVIGFVFTQIGM